MKEWITGRNPVYEVLAAHHRDSFQLRIADGAKVEGQLAKICDLARKYRLPVTKVPRKQLDQLSENHQGVALETAPYHYSVLKNRAQTGQIAVDIRNHIGHGKPSFLWNGQNFITRGRF